MALVGSARLTTVPGLIEVLRRPLAEMPRELELVPLPGPFDVIVRPPGSKSLTNRVLLLAALAKGESEIRGALLDADDAVVMIGALRQLGAGIEIDERASGRPVVRVRGTGGKLKGGCTLNLKNAGTATRFLTAAACLADGPVVIDGNERMRQRPIGELVQMLRSLGVTIDELGAAGCVPLRVHPAGLEGGEITVGTTQSSQFVSAIMLIAPLMKKGLTIRFTGPITSAAYIEMTVRLMLSWGYTTRDGTGEAVHKLAPRRDGTSLHVESSSDSWLAPSEFEVEPDASGATYICGAAAIVRRARAFTPGLLGLSLQGDGMFPFRLRNLGGEASPVGETNPCGAAHKESGWLVEGIGPALGTNVDLKQMPDAAMTLAAVACFASGTTTITGLRTLRVKETDRLAAIQTELSKLGVKVEIFQTRGAVDGGPPDEGLRITPPEGGVDCSPGVPRVEFDTYDDHRMAMSLALIGLRRPNVVIRDPQCVAKTYPTFWNDWALLYESASAGGAVRSNCR